METLIEKSFEILNSENSIKPNSKNQLTNGTLKYDSMVEALLLIRKNARRLLVIGLITFVSVFLFFCFYTNEHYSSVVFIMDDSDPEAVSTSETERLVLSQMNSFNKNRLFLLVYSDAMIKHLDHELKIGEHYNILKNNPGYENELSEKLREHVTFKKNDFNSVVMEVRDEDRYFAPKLANTIYQYLVELNRATVLENLRYKLSIYEKNISNFTEINNKDVDMMMHSLNNWPEFGNVATKNNENMFYLRRDLTTLFLNYSNSAKELKNNELIYSLTSNVMRDTSLQSLFLISKAYPDALSKKYMKIAGISFGLAIFAIIYCISSIYLYKKYKLYFHILYKKKLPEFYY